MKTLITVDNLDEYTCRLDSKIYVDPVSAILTPGAKDKLAEKGITVVYGPCPNAQSCTAHSHDAGTASSDERLFYGVAAVLQSDYGIKDMQQLKDLSCKAVAIIKANL